VSRFLVDTSVWSLAYRRDTPSDLPQVVVLRSALVAGEYVAITGMVLLELLRGFIPPHAQERILTDMAALELIEPTRDDYVEAARLANTCRQAGVQLGSVDALLAQLAIANDLELLTTDRDFENAAMVVPLRVWKSI
jgi:predicted nucleic acid-binding protein